MADTTSKAAQERERMVPAAQNTAAESGKKEFTRAELDAAVENRIQRERRKWEHEQSGTADKPDARLANANRRNLSAEAKLAAVSLGVPAARAAYAAKLADLSNVDMDDENGPDTAAVKKAVQKVLTDIPELKTTGQNEKTSGLRIGANNSAPKTESVPAAPAVSRVRPWNKFRV